MNIKLKPPCWVVHKETGAVLRMRSVSIPNGRLRAHGWNGLVCHVQNHKGTGIAEYRKFRAPTDDELRAFNHTVGKAFGI